jgi:hypothetical protein
VNDDVFDPERDAAEHEHFAHSDAVYVLGALDAEETAEYEGHLAGCPLCQAQVVELEGIRDVLARGAAPDSVEVTVPESLLPRLMEQVQRRRRHRRVMVAGALAACLLAVLSLVGVSLATRSDEPHPLALTPVAAAASGVTASVTLTRQTNGTGLRVVCGHYGAPSTVPSGGGYESPADLQTFRLVITNRLGQHQTPTSWNTDRDIRVDTGTNWPESAIRTIEIVDASGRAVMRLAL